MGFVVYEKENNRAVRYYEREASAKTQVTKNNRRVTIAILKGEVDWDSNWHRSYYSEHAYCAWAEFEAVVKQGYSKQMAMHHDF